MEKKCYDLKIPVWVLNTLTAFAGIIVTILIILISHVYHQGQVQGKMIEQIERLRLDLDAHIFVTRGKVDELRATKADSKDIDRIYGQLNRIEDHLKNLR